MDRIKGRMMYIVLIFMLLIIITAGVILVHMYKDFYRKNVLLRVDPLEFAGVKALDPTSEVQDSEIWMIGDSRVRRWPVELLKFNNTIALSLIHISEPTRLLSISYAVFCLKKKKKKKQKNHTR